MHAGVPGSQRRLEPPSAWLRALDRRDLAWGALLATLLALSPATGAGRVWASVLLGTLAAGCVVVFRGFRRAQWGARARFAPAVIAWPEPTVWVALVALGLAFGPTFGWLYSEYTTSIWRNGHGLFVPVVVALLARSALQGDTPRSPESSPWGVVLVALGLSCVVADSGVQSRYLSVVGLLVALPGASLALLGARRTRRIAFPLLLTVAAVPVPFGLIDPLGLVGATSVLMEWMLEILGVATTRHQSVFKIADGFIGVSQNCSGIAVFYAATCVALALAPRVSWPRRVAMLLAPWPITVIVNAVRGTALVWGCDRYGMPFLDLPFHGLSGVLAFWLVLGSVAVLALPLPRAREVAP